MKNKDKKMIKDKIKQLLEFDLNPKKIYPKDIFPEIHPELFEEINQELQNKFEFPLDRLSAHLMRMRLEVDRKLVEELLE